MQYQTILIKITISLITIVGAIDAIFVFTFGSHLLGRDVNKIIPLLSPFLTAIALCIPIAITGLWNMKKYAVFLYVALIVIGIVTRCAAGVHQNLFEIAGLGLVVILICLCLAFQRWQRMVWF